MIRKIIIGNIRILMNMPVSIEKKRKDYVPIGIPKEMVELIDKILEDKRFAYVSRQDFVRDAIRRRLDEILKTYSEK